MLQNIRIALIEPNPILLEGFYRTLESFPEMRVVLRSESARQVLAEADSLHTEVIISNMESADLDAVEMATLLRKAGSQMKLALYGSIHPGPLIKPLLRMGVCTYFVKDRLNTSELNEMIHEIVQHDFYYTDVVTREVVLSTWPLTDEGALPEFSDREEEVLTWVCRGKNRKQIADKLCLSEAAVKYHLQHIFEKAQVKTTQELLVTAIHLGWLDGLKFRRRLSA